MNKKLKDVTPEERKTHTIHETCINNRGEHFLPEEYPGLLYEPDVLTREDRPPTEKPHIYVLKVDPEIKNTLKWEKIYDTESFAKFFIAWVEDQVGEGCNKDILPEIGKEILATIHGKDGSDKWKNILHAVNNDCEGGDGGLNILCSEFAYWMAVQIGVGCAYYKSNSSLWNHHFCRFEMWIVLQNIKIDDRVRDKVYDTIINCDPDEDSMSFEDIENTALYMFDSDSLKTKKPCGEKLNAS